MRLDLIHNDDHRMNTMIAQKRSSLGAGYTRCAATRTALVDEDSIGKGRCGGGDSEVGRDCECECEAGACGGSVDGGDDWMADGSEFGYEADDAYIGTDVVRVFEAEVVENLWQETGLLAYRHECLIGVGASVVR
jgi:hypothetical protein